MSKNAMAGAVTLCGAELCLIGGAQLMQNSNRAIADVGSLAAMNAITTVAFAQVEPAVVWYGVSSPSNYYATTPPLLFRAWSDGTVEVKVISITNGQNWCDPSTPLAPCTSNWKVISSPTAGYKAAADVNADELVNGIDLASVLDSWGDAPRVPFPPSDCPLNLINP